MAMFDASESTPRAPPAATFHILLAVADAGDALMHEGAACTLGQVLTAMRAG